VNAITLIEAKRRNSWRSANVLAIEIVEPKKAAQAR
jgi:hypothetical protein